MINVDVVILRHITILCGLEIKKFLDLDSSTVFDGGIEGSNYHLSSFSLGIEFWFWNSFTIGKLKILTWILKLCRIHQVGTGVTKKSDIFWITFEMMPGTPWQNRIVPKISQSAGSKCYRICYRILCRNQGKIRKYSLFWSFYFSTFLIPRRESPIYDRKYFCVDWSNPAALQLFT